LAYESITQFEDDLNADLKTGNLKAHVAAVPLSRDQLAPALLTGKVDLIAAMLTVTPERRALAAFSEPTRTNVSQVVVTGPGAPPIATLDDLAGQEVFVREQSLYAESLTTLNGQLKARGKAPVVITALPIVLEDDDVLEMVNAGLVPITITDDYLAQFGRSVHRSDRARRCAVDRWRTGGAVRKENPQLLNAVNTWIRKHGKGDPFRNTIERRYLDNVKYARNAASEAERRNSWRSWAVQEVQRARGLPADGAQAIRVNLDQNVRAPWCDRRHADHACHRRDLKVGDIAEIEANIHAGVKYMRFMMDQYYKDEPMDNLNKALMTFASYNAGPGRVRQLRREAEKKGLNPNVWFDNVERVASERIGGQCLHRHVYQMPSPQAGRRAGGTTERGEAGGKGRWLMKPHGCSLTQGCALMAACGLSRRLPRSPKPTRGSRRCAGFLGRDDRLQRRHQRHQKHPRVHGFRRREIQAGGRLLVSR
jgi:membrane-bound lytic murein transglycosylase MltF